jgi:plasmid stabilization system protein ParE
VTIEILPDAQRDLVAGFRFYELRSRGLGNYFLDSLFSDIELLADSGGIHASAFTYHRSLSKRFPFAIYYRVENRVARVRAILDCRRRPSWIRRQLRSH